MPLVCPNNNYIKVYQHDYVTDGVAHGLFSVYKNKSDFLNNYPPLKREHIDFTFDVDAGTTIEVQAENYIQTLNEYSTCTDE